MSPTARHAALALALSGCGAFVTIPDYTRPAHVDEHGACERGFGDCNGDRDDGCEVDLTTDSDCGACGVACVNGTCKVDGGGDPVCACAPGFAACGDDPRACLSALAFDAHDCGACGVTCDPGICLSGHCQPFAVVSDTDATFASLAVVGDRLYYDEGQEIRRASAGASVAASERVLYISGAFCAGVAADAEHLVWVQWADGIGAIWTGALDGTGAIQLTGGFPTQRFIASGSNALAIADGYAYFIAADSSTFQSTLKRVPLAGGAVESLASLQGLTPYLAVGSHDIYWSAFGADLSVHPRAAPATSSLLSFGPHLFAVAAFQERACFLTTNGGNGEILCGSGADQASYMSVSAVDGLLGSIAFDDRGVIAASLFDFELRAFGQGLRDPLAVTEGAGGALVIVGDDLFWRTASGIYGLRHAFDP